MAVSFLSHIKGVNIKVIERRKRDYGKKENKIIGKPPPDWNFCVGKETRVYLEEWR